jgi:2-polyprenyl-3-methyl-5-hydroxy-6-metoxy-1,4-benzoquinol methylase
MGIGKIVRKILGNKLFAAVARVYRRFFLDINKLTDTLNAIIPANAKILDIGGGDGEVVNRLLELRKDLSVTMIDLSASIGKSLSHEFMNRIRLMPGTSIKEFGNRNDIEFNTIIISDVIHHVPVSMREQFFTDIREVCNRRNQTVIIIIKEFHPGSFKSWLGYISDRYISGDKNVCFISEAELQSQLSKVFKNVNFLPTDLFVVNKPNYAFYFSI